MVHTPLCRLNVDINVLSYTATWYTHTTVQTQCRHCVVRSQVVGRVVSVLCVLLYLAYSGYALYRQWGTEAATRLLVLLVIVLWLYVGRPVFRQVITRLPKLRVQHGRALKLRKIARW